MTSDYAKKKAAKKKEAIKVKLGKDPTKVREKKGWCPDDPKPDPRVQAKGKKASSKSTESGMEKTAEEELCQQVEEKAKVVE